MAKYKAYTEYKDSGVEWLGDIPTHWQLIPCRAAVSHVVDKNNDGKIQNYLSLMANVGVIRYEDKGDVGNKKPDDLTKCKIVKKGQLVINSMNYGIGSYGMSPFDGICSPVYIILEPRGNVLKRYALRIFENTPFQKHLATFGNGILEHRSAIKWDDIKGQVIPLPSKDEQKTILKFLDHETAKIDNLIEKQQHLIELLKEKRQAVISHAITKGLVPDVPMKDSGIDWLGKVPEHWNIIKLKYLINILEQGWSPQCEARLAEENEYGVLKVGCVNSGEFNPFEHKALPSNLQPQKQYLIKKNDLLISRANTKELVGSSAVVEKDYNNLILCDKLYRLKFGSLVNPHFISEFIRTPIVRKQIELSASGASHSMQNIGQDTIKELFVALPPESETQQLIAFIKNKINVFNSLIGLSQKQVSLLQERRTALISAAVTGKIDVRDWVAPDTQKAEESEETAV